MPFQTKSGLAGSLVSAQAQAVVERHPHGLPSGQTPSDRSTTAFKVDFRSLFRLPLPHSAKNLWFQSWSGRGGWIENE